MWEEHHKAPYMYKQTKWVSYDNEESIREKVHFAYDHGLAGVMTWSIDTDDFRGVCGGPHFPLLRTIKGFKVSSVPARGGGAYRPLDRPSGSLGGPSGSLR